MKIKDLPKGTSLSELKVKTPKGVVGYWRSQWMKGVWFTDGQTNRIYPQHVDSLADCSEWEVTDEPINCDKLTDFEYTNNCKTVKPKAQKNEGLQSLF